MGKKKYQLIALGTFFVLVLIALVLFWKVQRQTEKTSQTPNQNTTDKVPDLYEGESIDVEDPKLLRARFDKFEDGKIYLQIGSAHPVNQDQYQVTVDDSTVYGCLSRHMQVGDQKIDRLQMYLDTDKFQGNSVPEGQNLEWFLGTVEIGEAVEVRSIDDGKGNLKPGIIYVYKETCPAE